VVCRLPTEPSSGGWNRTSGLHVQSVASLPTVTAPESSIREEGFEPPPPDSKSGSLPVSRFPRAPRGSRTRLSDLGSPCLAARPETLVDRESGIGDSNPGRLVGSQESCRWTNPAVSVTIKRKERESNPQGSSLARFRIGCRHPSACPSNIPRSLARLRRTPERQHRREESNLQSSP
jgi:hypothetical protein